VKNTRRNQVLDLTNTLRTRLRPTEDPVSAPSGLGAGLARSAGKALGLTFPTIPNEAWWDDRTMERPLDRVRVLIRETPHASEPAIDVCALALIVFAHDFMGKNQKLLGLDTGQSHLG